MMKFLFNKISIFFLAAALFASCKDQWEDHNALKHAVLGVTLDQLVNSTPSLSKFNDYLKRTGYDKLLASSKVFTVWAPSDDALNSLDQSIVNDSAKLRQFVANHIAFQEYPMEQSADVKIKMLNGKNLTYTYLARKLDTCKLDQAKSDQFCKNGILHLLNSPIYPKLNIWEYLKGYRDSANYSVLSSYLTYYERIFDAINSVRTGTDSLGNAIYDTVWIYRNIFLYNASDVSNEDSTYTLFVINNDSYTNEFNIMKPYLTDTTSNSAINSTTWSTEKNVFKDIVIQGTYTMSSLPDSFYSTKGIKIRKKNLVGNISEYNASNGHVIAVNGSFSIPKEDKIPTVIIEGENYSGKYDGATFNSISVGLLGIRARSWASGGEDLNVTGGTNGHKTPYLSIGYYSPNLYSIKYDIYWRAINDFQSSAFTQRISINAQTPAQLIDSLSSTLIKLKWVYPVDASKLYLSYNQTETLLGTWTNLQYGIQRFFLVANGINSGSWNDPLALDYIKLVPNFN